MSYGNLRRGRHSEPGREYLVTAVTRYRTQVFADFHGARLLIDTFRETQHDGLADWLTWVVMPDHFHALIKLREASLPEIMRRVRSVSSRRINQSLGRTGSLWQPNYHDHALRLEEDRRSIARYIVSNPLRAGLVNELGSYPHWDAVWL